MGDVLLDMTNPLTACVLGLAVLCACTGHTVVSPSVATSSGAPRESPQTPPAFQDAGQIMTWLQAATPPARDCIPPVGDNGIGCRFEGEWIEIYSLSDPTNPLDTRHLPHQPMIAGTTWLIEASSLPQAQALQRLLGGVIFIHPKGQ